MNVIKIATILRSVTGQWSVIDILVGRTIDGEYRCQAKLKKWENCQLKGEETLMDCENLLLGVEAGTYKIED